jgi:hypothetical protein
MMPDLFHVVPVCDDAVFDRVPQSDYTMFELSFVTVFRLDHRPVFLLG